MQYLIRFKGKDIPLILVLSLLIFSLSCQEENSSEENIYLENGKIRLGFNQNNGGLTSLSDLSGHYELLDDSVRNKSPWEIESYQSERQPAIFDIYNASKFRFSKPDSSTLILRWKKFQSAENKNTEVVVTVKLEAGKAFSFWEISVNNIKGQKIKQVIFPRIAGIRGSENENLAVPQWMGQLIEDPRFHLAEIKGREKKYEWSYPGLSLQCLALYDRERYGFYASCNDSLVYNKNFSFSLDSSDFMVYRMHNFPPADTSLFCYKPKYSGVIGTFRGDWVTAAEIYREWGSEQQWAKKSRLKKGLTPEWLENTALWEWNRGKSGNVLTPATGLMQRLGLPVSVFWHWWHGCSYDDGFPEYLPPREGRESFSKALTSAQSKGIKAIVYMNQRLWGTTTESWKTENAGLYAVKDADGKINTHIYNIFTNKSTASMCLGTKFWKDKYSSLCDSVVNTYKANGVYMDQACLTLACYDRNHGHPAGQGNYWFRNFAYLSGQIRGKIPGGKNLVLAGEGCSEAWIPYLDAFLTLDVSKERYAGPGPWKTIPFFQAVYHQYAITYGNYSSLLVPPYDELWPKKYAPEKPLEMLDEDYSRQFLMEQARSFVWGLQPTISNYREFLASERKNEIDFLIDLARTRNSGLKYLLYGKFVRSPDIDSPEEEFEMSKLSIYAGKYGESITSFRGRYPILYAGSWLADDMDLGIALASISDNPVEVSFNFRSEEYGLSSSGNIFIINNKGKRFLTSYSDGTISVDITMNARDLCILEIKPERGKDFEL
jgi:hypothetical protein